jgi:hypothetical protein
MSPIISDMRHGERPRYCVFDGGSWLGDDPYSLTVSFPWRFAQNYRYTGAETTGLLQWIFESDYRSKQAIDEEMRNIDRQCSRCPWKRKGWTTGLQVYPEETVAGNAMHGPGALMTAYFHCYWTVDPRLIDFEHLGLRQE